jgi:two-component sensor histidine kinase
VKINTKGFFKRAGRLLLHPAVLVIPFAVAIWLMIPGIHNRYKCELVDTRMQNEGNNCTYVDFDNDGYSEHFFTGLWKGKLFATFFNNTEAYQQFNFPGVFTPSKRFVCGDINNDRKKELFFFMVVNDSIIINVINPVKGEQAVLQQKFLTMMEKSGIQSAWEIPDVQLHDLNNDGTSEVIILVTAGYQKRPRRVFAFDVANDTVIGSPEIGGYGTNLHFYTENSMPRIAVDNYAAHNYLNDTTGGMNDLSSYRIILDENLNFRYPPVEEKGDFVMYRTFPIYHNRDTFLLTTVMENQKDAGWRLTVSDMAGKSLKSIFIASDQESQKLFSTFNDRSGNTRILGFYKADQIVILDHNLEVTHRRKIKAERLWEYFPDLDNDGNPELIFNSINPREMIILRHNLRSPVRVEIAANGYVHPVNVILRGDKPPHFMMQVDSVVYNFRYYSSIPFLPYLALLTIYLLIFGFTLMIRRIQKNQLKKKFETQQTICQLQYLSIRNQMDPHFTFNILNTIGAMTLQNKPDESYKMLMKYSKLLRNTLASSDKLLVSIEEEINFVTNYLELQKIRFRDKLNYFLTIGPDVNPATIVPKMVIHNYVENAIKHGLDSLNNNGLITINITAEQSHLRITITDNGIGRRQAALNGTESGKGHQIMHQFYNLLNETKGITILKPSGATRFFPFCSFFLDTKEEPRKIKAWLARLNFGAAA